MARILRSKSGMERLRLAHDAWELAHDRLVVSGADIDGDYVAEWAHRLGVAEIRDATRGTS